MFTLVLKTIFRKIIVLVYLTVQDTHNYNLDIIHIWLTYLGDLFPSWLPFAFSWYVCIDTYSPLNPFGCIINIIHRKIN